MSIEVRQLSFGYGRHQVLHDMSFRMEKGQLLSVLGPNGVGKSTLFRCILGLLKGYDGEITLNGKPIAGLSARDLARQIAYIPQSHYPSFNYTVFDMVLMGTSSHVSAVSSPGRREEALVRDTLERLGIAEFADRYYTQISGGERQLVLIARALAQKSPVLIMDEPTANLDYGNQMRVLTTIRELADSGYTIIQSTHNPEQAYQFSHEILAMKEGRIVAHGPPSLVITPEIIQILYAIDVEVESLRNDKFRICIPKLYK